MKEKVTLKLLSLRAKIAHGFIGTHLMKTGYYSFSNSILHDLISELLLLGMPL